MAEARLARLIRTERMGPEARLLTFAMAGGELRFTGGQYIIVNTGIELGGGKLAKRAYSILSTDDEQQEFQLAVRRIGEGPGSNFMHRIAVGAEIPFSGPWGKFLPDSVPGPRFVFATDTGITAALGLIRGRHFRESATDTTVIWFVESDDYFVPVSFARASMRSGLAAFEVALAPPVDDASRLERALALVDRSLGAQSPACAFLAGDGAIIYPLRERLVATGVPPENIRLEAFFNNPDRKARP
jgi:ferredoxin-NADP reductase